jgi:hypothetical protein
MAGGSAPGSQQIDAAVETSSNGANPSKPSATTRRTSGCASTWTVTRATGPAPGRVRHISSTTGVERALVGHVVSVTSTTTARFAAPIHARQPFGHALPHLTRETEAPESAACRYLLSTDGGFSLPLG